MASRVPRCAWSCRTASRSSSASASATAWTRRCAPARRRSTGARSVASTGSGSGCPSRLTELHADAGRAVVHAGAPGGRDGTAGARAGRLAALLAAGGVTTASTRLPQTTARTFQPLHRDSCDFPSPVQLFTELGVREWFAPLQSRGRSLAATKRYCVEKDALTLPTFALQVIDRRPAGRAPRLRPRGGRSACLRRGHGRGPQLHRQFSGPLPEPVAEVVRDEDLVVAAVLSGNRNFEGRIHPQVRASYLASPPLVVAYALAGTVDIDLTTEPLGFDPDGRPVYLRDLWPTQEEIQETLARVVKPEIFATRVRAGLRRRRPLARAATAGGGQRPLRLGPRLDLRAQADLLRRHERDARAAARHHRRARARLGRRLGDDGPHLARRLDPDDQPRRAIPDRAWRHSRATSTATARGAATTR